MDTVKKIKEVRETGRRGGQRSKGQRKNRHEVTQM